MGWVREQEAKQRAAEERLQVAQRRREEEEARVRAREREKGRKMQEAKAVAQRSKQELVCALLSTVRQRAG